MTTKPQTFNTSEVFEQILLKKGPDPGDYQIILDSCAELKDEMGVECLPEEFMNQYFSSNSNIGWGYFKPLGYAGDYLMIDRIYTQHTAIDQNEYKWDIFFNQFPAVKAVRNRKTYFKNLLLRKSLQSTRTLRVLNLASGPARDLLEFFQENPDADIHITCVELDPRAIAYAKNLLGDFNDRVTFVERNVFKYHTSDTFDLIWSAGLFDYFTDDVFVRLIRRFHTDMLAPQGELIVGNFHPRNPSRAVMELLGDWFLHHRTEAELEQLAREAIPQVRSITIDQEPEGINLFLRMPK